MAQPDNKLSVKVVVNGTETLVETTPNAALSALIAKALNQTQNTGRSPEDWLLKDEKGTELDRNRKASDYGIKDGTVLFLTLKAGIGGTR